MDLLFDNYGQEVDGALAVENKVKILLLTVKGELRFDPDYGTLISYYLFEENGKKTADKIILEARTALERYVPEFFLKSIDVQSDVANSTTRIKITGRVEDSSDDTNIQVDF